MGSRSGSLGLIARSGNAPIATIALKNLLAQEGNAPEGIDAIVERVKQTGRPVQVSSAVERIRRELGLDPLPELDASELKEILR
jgi:heterodisulfide reductase subunit C